MEATKQTKMTKEDLHLSWKDKLNIIRDNRYFLMLFPIVMLAVMILIFGVATAGRFFKLSVMKGILSQAIIIGTCATGVAFIYSNGNLDISIGAVLGLAATLGVKAYSVTQSVVVMILATVAVALGLMAFNCTMSVVCNIKTITVAIVVTQIYGAISTLLIGGSGKIDLDMSVAAMLEDGGFRYVAFFGYFIFCVVIYHFTRSLFGGWLEENASEDGSEGFLISTSLAAQGNTQHVEITRAILEGLQQKYGITYTKSIDDLIASSETTNVENDKNILITLYPGSPNKDTWLPGISTLLQTGNYKMFMSSGQTYNQSATVVDEVEKSFGINIKVASVGALGTTLETAFNTKDSSGNSSVDLVAIKAVSTQTAAMFAATYNALVSGAECRACRGEDGLPVYFTFNFIPITSAEQLTEMSGWDAKETGNWIANKDFVDQMLVTVNPDVTSDDINAIMQSLSYEKIKEMMG